MYNKYTNGFGIKAKNRKSIMMMLPAKLNMLIKKPRARMNLAGIPNLGYLKV